VRNDSLWSSEVIDFGGSQKRVYTFLFKIVIDSNFGLAVLGIGIRWLKSEKSPLFFFYTNLNIWQKS